MTKVNGIEIKECVEGDERVMIAVPTTGDKARTIRISLKQWRMFHAVVDSNGFVEAAEKLHMSQSAISHALAKLQEHLGVALLTLKGRKAQITEEGKVLLERSRELLRHAVELEDLAENLRQGWGAEIRLIIDPDFPSDILMRALRGFSTSAQNVRLSVQEALADRACQSLLDNAVDFAITTRVLPGYISNRLAVIEYVPVAHKNNSLFSLKRYVTADDLRTQRQIVVAGANDYLIAGSGCPLTYSVGVWSVSSHDRAIDALCASTGYAWLPKYRLLSLLEENVLRVLPMLEASSYTSALYLITGHSVRGNSCAIRLADALRAQGGAVY
ncbi:MAG: LysR family transcriptional regulator [Pseudomonadota bacterium]